MSNDGRTNSAIEERRTNGPGGRQDTRQPVPVSRDHDAAARLAAQRQAKELEDESTRRQATTLEPGKCASCGRPKVAIDNAIVGVHGAVGSPFCGPDCYGWRLAPMPAAR